MGLMEAAVVAVKDAINRGESRIVVIEPLLWEMTRKHPSSAPDQVMSAIVHAIALYGGAAEFAGNSERTRAA